MMLGNDARGVVSSIHLVSIIDALLSICLLKHIRAEPRTILYSNRPLVRLEAGSPVFFFRHVCCAGASPIAIQWFLRMGQPTTFQSCRSLLLLRLPPRVEDCDIAAGTVAAAKLAAIASLINVKSGFAPP